MEAKPAFVQKIANIRGATGRLREQILARVLDAGTEEYGNGEKQKSFAILSCVMAQICTASLLWRLGITQIKRQ